MTKYNNVAQKLEFVFGMVENSISSLSHNVFNSLLSQGYQKSRLCGKGHHLISCLQMLLIFADLKLCHLINQVKLCKGKDQQDLLFAEHKKLSAVVGKQYKAKVTRYLHAYE